MNKTISKLYETSTIKLLNTFYIKGRTPLNYSFYFLLCIQFLSNFANTTTLPPIYVWGGSLYELFFATITFLFSLVALTNILFTILFDHEVTRMDKLLSLILLIVAALYFLTNIDSNSTEIPDFLLCISACIGKSSEKIIKFLLIPGTIFLLIIQPTETPKM